MTSFCKENILQQLVKNTPKDSATSMILNMYEQNLRHLIGAEVIPIRHSKEIELCEELKKSFSKDNI